MDIRVLFLLAVVNLPLYPLLGSLLFGGRAPFLTATRRLDPGNARDLAAWLLSDRDTLVADLLLGVYLGGCFALVVAEYRLLETFCGFGG